VEGPEVSVVVPTRFRETRLAFLLDALAVQTLAPERFEVIVVRADDALAGPLTVAPAGLAVRFLESPRGAAGQRNAGWRAAGAPLIAFTDDDCRPAPDWLERLLAATDGADSFIQGRTEPDPDEWRRLRGFARTIDVTAFDVWAPTCNMAYPRELLERVGGFDERFVEAWGEDTDLALRARAAGARQVYEDRARVWHAVHPRTLAVALREGTARNTIPIVVARHPRLREALHFRVFLLMSHALLALGIVGLLLAGRRPYLGSAAFIPYVRHHLHGSGLGPVGLLRWLAFSAPRSALIDATEMAASAAASARHRSLVL
jgi:GT2 family glycosyltransferase